MKKTILLFVATTFLNNCFAQTIPVFPIAVKKPVTDTFFKKYAVTDNYRWMENLDNPDLKKWAADENEIAEKFISRSSSKNGTYDRINVLSNVHYHNMVKKGDYYFFSAYYTETGLPALFRQTSLTDEEPRLIIDPNFISHKDNITIKEFEVSHDSKYLAYQFGRNGSDWAEINVATVDGLALKDHLTDVKFSGIEWWGNGFFYSKYPHDNIGPTQGQVVYYHKLGTQQNEDEVTFKRNDPSITFDFSVTSDERYFILEEHNKKAGIFNYFYMDHKDAEPALKPLLMNLKYGIDIINNHGDKLIATSFHNADNGTIVEIDLKEPLKWRTISPAFTEALLLETVPLKNNIITVYQTHQRPSIVVMDYEGKVLHTQTFPLGTSIHGLHGMPDDAEVLYSYQSYTTPPVVYRFNVQSYERRLTGLTKVNFDYENYEYKETSYTTADSVKIPMMLICKKGIKLDGTNPTLLETYGGFGSVNYPQFDPGLVYFLSKGGVYAYAYIRGEGELGAKWARDGRGTRKQTTFSDFISGAEYLIKEGYTSPAKLAAAGASNGGLVVAVAAIQRPDLFKAVIPEVAPFDMLRFENFTVGSLHTAEYGTVRDSTSFTRLYNYSPYNNIKPNVNYPAMLVITSDNDDRVPPLHSYKFTAQIQNRPAQTNPVYLLINKKSGHNGISNNNLISMLQEKVNFYSFIVEMLK